MSSCPTPARPVRVRGHWTPDHCRSLPKPRSRSFNPYVIERVCQDRTRQAYLYALRSFAYSQKVRAGAVPSPGLVST